MNRGCRNRTLKFLELHSPVYNEPRRRVALYMDRQRWLGRANRNYEQEAVETDENFSPLIPNLCAISITMCRRNCTRKEMFKDKRKSL
jgi:hypothetical protein